MVNTQGSNMKQEITKQIRKQDGTLVYINVKLSSVFTVWGK